MPGAARLSLHTSTPAGNGLLQKETGDFGQCRNSNGVAGSPSKAVLRGGLDNLQIYNLIRPARRILPLKKYLIGHYGLDCNYFEHRGSCLK